MVWMDYPIRMVGQTTCAILVAATLYTQGNTYWVPYVLLFLQGLYPHLAFFCTLHSKNPKRLEFYFLYFDAFLMGVWTAYIDYSILPSMAMIISNSMANISVGGFPLALKCWGALLLGLILVSIFHGVHFQPSSNLILGLSIVFFHFLYCNTMGYIAFRRATELRVTQKQLSASYEEVDSLNKTLKSASTSLELKPVLHQIYESFNLLFSFDFMTLQIVDVDNNELHFRNYHGLTATRKEDDLYQLHVKLNHRNCFSVKAYIDTEAVYIPNISAINNLSFSDKNIQEIIDFTSVLYMPLITQKEILGVIGFYSRKKMIIDEKILQSLKSQLSTISLILRNAILYEDARKGNL